MTLQDRSPFPPENHFLFRHLEHDATSGIISALQELGADSSPPGMTPCLPLLQAFRGVVVDRGVLPELLQNGSIELERLEARPAAAACSWFFLSGANRTR